MRDAGNEFTIKPFGGRALMSMRLEKNWGAWTLDYRPDFTAKETGLDVFINWNKDFIGKDSAQKDESKNKLVPLIVETNDIDVTYNEAVLKGDKSIGYITSGGFAHFVNKSVAFSYVDQNELKSEKGIQVEINGDFFNCSIILSLSKDLSKIIVYTQCPTASRFHFLPILRSKFWMEKLHKY